MTAAASATALPGRVVGFSAIKPSVAGNADKRAHDPTIPMIVALSLIAHVGLILPMLFDRHDVAPSSQEIPVDVVQLPAPKPAPPQVPNAAPPRPAPQAQQKPAPQKLASEQKTSSHHTTPTEQKAAQQQHVAERMQQLFGAMPAIVLPGASDAGDEEVAYKQLVLSKVAKAKPEGRSRGIPGAASVSFTVGDNGELVRCEILRKSIDPKLDAEAIAMIRRGAPYPAPPAGGQRDFVVTLRFAAMP